MSYYENEKRHRLNCADKKAGTWAHVVQDAVFAGGDFVNTNTPGTLKHVYVLCHPNQLKHVYVLCNNVILNTLSKCILCDVRFDLHHSLVSVLLAKARHCGWLLHTTLHFCVYRYRMLLGCYLAGRKFQLTGVLTPF